MTACVNRKHTKKVAAVVTASLVGALSLGVAPVVAMADDAEISTQSVEPSVAWTQGTLTYAHDNHGHRINDLTNMEFEKGTYPMPIQVTPKNGKPVSVIHSNVDYRDASGASVNMETAGVGTYTMEIKDPDGSFGNATLKVKFRIVGKSLKGLSVFDQSNMDTSDTTFTYTGKPQEIGFILDGKVLDKENDLNNHTPFHWEKLEYVYAGSSKPVGGIPTEAGDYVVRVHGEGEYEGSYVEIPFTIEKLDLSASAVTIVDVMEAAAQHTGMPKKAYVDGNLLDTDDLKFTFVSSEKGYHSVGENDTYIVNVSAASKNVTGSKDATFSVVDKLVNTSDLHFKGDKVGNWPNDPYYILTSDLNRTAIDEDSFSIDRNLWNFDAKLTIEIVNAAGEKVDFYTMNTVIGDYTVTVRVDAKTNGYEYGSDALTMDVHTRKDRITANTNLYFTLDGQVVSGLGMDYIEYTGSNIADRIGTVLEYNGKALTAGTDYKVTLYKYEGFDGRFFWKQVDSATDCGIYNVVVSSGDYMLELPFQDCDYTFAVEPMKIDVKLGSDQLKTFDGKDRFIPYTGEAASYYFYYEDADGNEVRLPEGAIALSHFYFTAPGEKTIDVDEICEIGKYEASILLGENGSNYEIANADYQTNSIKVSDAKVFTDVPTTYWAAENIYNADALGYMNGYNGTTFFGPMDNIKRGDVVVTLFKMAGQPDGWQEDFQTSLGGFNTGFNDVDPGKYYAEAIAWAKAVGITTGDSGTNNFRPEDQISRQELAKMLCVYAEKTGKDVTVDADAVLAKYDDADTVSPWAEEYVAWAVEAGIMGQDSPLRGTDPINRAEVATMAVRLQPKPIEMTEDLIPRPHFGF